MKTLIKQFVLLMFFVSGILNFPAMKEGLNGTLVDRMMSGQYGGYFSWPLIKGLELIFGDSILAVRIVVVVLALVVIGWLLYVLNIKLPPLPKINVTQYEKPQKKTEKSDGRPFITREAKITSDSDLFKKVSQAAGAFSSESRGSEGSLLKDLLKKQLEAKLEG